MRGLSVKQKWFATSRCIPANAQRQPLSNSLHSLSARSGSSAWLENFSWSAQHRVPLLRWMRLCAASDGKVIIFDYWAWLCYSFFFFTLQLILLLTLLNWSTIVSESRYARKASLNPSHCLSCHISFKTASALANSRFLNFHTVVRS